MPKSRKRKDAKPYRNKAPEYVTSPIVLFEKIGRHELDDKAEALACDMLLASVGEMTPEAAFVLRTAVGDAHFPPTTHDDIRAIAYALAGTEQTSAQ